MLLRTRITLMVLVVFLALIVFLVVEGNWKKAMAEAEMDRARMLGQQSTWAALVDNALQQPGLLAQSAVRNGTLTAALTDNDRAGVAAAVKTLQQEFGSKVIGASVEIARADGEPVIGAEGGDAVLGKAVASAAGRAGGTVGGLYYARSGMPVLGVVAPLYSRSGLVGAVGVFVDLGPTVKALAAAVGADVALIDPAGKFPAVSNEALPLTGLAGASGPGVELVADRGRRLRVTRTLVEPAVDGPAAALHGVQDVTESAKRSFWLAVISLGAAVSGAALSLAFLHWYMRQSFRPLHEVIRMLGALARGERPAAAIAGSGRDEIGRLAATASDFRAGLDARDQLLKLRRDIEAAHDIQTSILPDAPPERPGFAVRTYMHAARDVGGDFYDYFDLPDGRLGFVIADVSGKGIGAALFMAVACTVIRSTARLVPDPGECLAMVNDLLAANNAQSMFVTAFYGIFAADTGKVVYANAGHNPPYRVGGDGQVAMLPTTKGKLLGLFPGKAYATAQIVLDEGESLYLYTDGVTEAQDAAGSLYGERRLEASLTGASHRREDLLLAVLDDVTAFVGEAQQADDITCLTLSRR